MTDMMTVRDPFQLAAPYIVDPFYAQTQNAALPQSGVFAAMASGPCWLYNAGHLEAYLLQRKVDEAFASCRYIGYPGVRRPVAPNLFARQTIILNDTPTSTLTVYHGGEISIAVNGMQVAHFDVEPETIRREVDLRHALRLGENTITVTVCSGDVPPTFAITGTLFRTDMTWQVSCDAENWAQPTAVPCGDATPVFPHNERLPEYSIPAQRIDENLYDFGVEVFGKPVLSVHGSGTVQCIPGESRKEAMVDQPELQEQHPVICEVSTGEHTADRPMALRYLRVVPTDTVRVDGVALQAACYPVRYQGAFACSDEMLTRIWWHAAYTLRLCMHELFIDGVKRDRLPWVGDLYLAGLCNYYTFGERNIVRNTMRALETHSTEHPDPNSIIDYTLYWVIAMRDYLLYTGDRESVRASYGYAHTLLQTVQAREDARGMIPTDRCEWIFIDWASVEKTGVCAALQMLYVLALEAMAEVARNLDDDTLAGVYSEKTTRLRENCRKVFWNAHLGAFVDNLVEGEPGMHISRHTNLFAVLSGVATAEQYPQLCERVLCNSEVEAVGTPYMMAFEASALAASGNGAEMQTRIREYWGGMIVAGATTFWEAYDATASGDAHYAFYDRPYGKSLCHAWSAGPALLLPSEILGVRPLASGWARFTIAPQLGTLAWACADIPTPQGSIRIDCNGDEAMVTVPAGTTLVYPARQSNEQQCYAGPTTVTIKMQH